MALNDPKTYPRIFLAISSMFNLHSDTKQKIPQQLGELGEWLVGIGNQETEALLEEIKAVKLAYQGDEELEVFEEK